jgi:hypothetical protein
MTREAQDLAEGSLARLRFNPERRGVESEDLGLAEGSPGRLRFSPERTGVESARFRRMVLGYGGAVANRPTGLAQIVASLRRENPPGPSLEKSLPNMEERQ